MSIKKSINIFFSRLWINKSAIFKLACTYTGVVFTFWGFVSLFEPLNGVFQDDASFVCKLLIGILVLLAVLSYQQSQSVGKCFTLMKYV